MKDPERKLNEIMKQAEIELATTFEKYDTGIEKLSRAPEYLKKSLRKLGDTTLYYVDLQTKDNISDSTITWFRNKLNARRLRLQYWFMSPSLDNGFICLSILFYSIH